MALHIAKHYTEWLRLGRAAEAEGETEKAAEYYEKAIRQEPMEALPYNRLMVIYRKLKKYRDELRVVNKALKVYTEFYDEKPERLFAKNKKALQTGRALARALEGKKKKPDAAWYPEPVSKWLKRKEVIEKKLPA